MQISKQLFRSQLLAFSYFVWAACPTFAASEEDQELYESLLSDANIQLTQSNQERSCPGVALTLSCGDGKCDGNKGENELNCPVDCLNSTVKSYNGQTFCTQVKKLSAPSSAEEVAMIVREAVRSGQHVRAVGRAHTTNQLICTDGVEISTENLNRIHGIEKLEGDDVVVVDPGVRLSELTDWLDQKGLSLGYQLVQFRGVTIAGALATGAHGSSPRHSSVISSSVKAISWVGADGLVHDSNESNSDPSLFAALRANLGMMGIIVRVKLKVQPQFRLDSQVSYLQDRELFAPEGLIHQVRQCDFAQLMWFPHSQKLIKVCANETQKAAEPGAENSLLDPPVPDFIVRPYQLVMHYGACFSGLRCTLEDLREASLRVFPPFKKSLPGGAVVNVSHLVGLSHKVMTSQLTGKRGSINQMDLEVAVPLSRAQKALEYISAQLKLNHSCLPLLGVLIRFVLPEDTTLIAHTVLDGEFKKGEPAVLFELPVYSPVGLSSAQEANYENPYREIAEALMRDYGGRAHRGKNDESLFRLQKELGRYGDRLAKFKKIREQVDPQGVFLNDFINEL